MPDVVQEVLRLTEELEAKRQEAIKELLRQRREVVKDIDAKLSQLGYQPSSENSTVFVQPPGQRRKRGPMTDEHKRKIAESRARNKAAKEGGAAPEEKPARLVKKGAEG
jgi:hypothetical protein